MIAMGIRMKEGRKEGKVALNRKSSKLNFQADYPRQMLNGNKMTSRTLLRLTDLMKLSKLNTFGRQKIHCSRRFLLEHCTGAAVGNE